MSITAKYANPNSGYAMQQKFAKSTLTLNKHYEVESLIIYSSTTDVYLKDHSKSFNSVFFDFYQDGKYLESDIDSEAIQKIAIHDYITSDDFDD